MPLSGIPCQRTAVVVIIRFGESKPHSTRLPSESSLNRFHTRKFVEFAEEALQSADAELLIQGSGGRVHVHHEHAFTSESQLCVGLPGGNEPISRNSVRSGDRAERLVAVGIRRNSLTSIPDSSTAKPVWRTIHHPPKASGR
jgi:hypothetical protein